MSVSALTLPSAGGALEPYEVHGARRAWAKPAEPIRSRIVRGKESDALWRTSLSYSVWRTPPGY